MIDTNNVSCNCKDGKFEVTAQMTVKGNCCCCGNEENGDCPHPSYPFTGKAMADFGQTERCVAIRKEGSTGGTGGGSAWYEQPVEEIIPAQRAGRYGMAVSGDGKWIVTKNEENAPNSLLIYKKENDVWTKQLVPTAFTENGVQYIKFAPDSQQFVVAHAKSPYISIYELVNDVWTLQSKPTGTLSDSKTDWVAFSTDGNKMAVSSRYWGTYILNKVDGKWVSEGKIGSSNDSCAAFMPDGNTIVLGNAYSNADNLTMFTLIENSWVKQTMPSLRSRVNKMDISKDGKWLAVTTSVAPLICIYKFIGNVWVKQAVDAVEEYSDVVRFLNDSQTLIAGKTGTIYTLKEDKWEKTASLVFEGTQIYDMDITTDDSMLVVKPLDNIYIYHPDSTNGGGEEEQNELHPYTNIQQVAAMEGYVGHGFTQTALAEGETGTADIMFE